MTLKYFFFALVLLSFLFFQSCRRLMNPSPDYTTWTVAGGNSHVNKYSGLTGIDTSNVQHLQPAWTYHTGDADQLASTQIQCNPLIIKGTLYGTSPQLVLFALDAATGKPKWTYSPVSTVVGDKKSHFNMNNNRGVAYWTDGKDQERIFYTTGPYLQAVDAKTGILIDGFGQHGRIDLHAGLGSGAASLFVTATSAPSVYKDLVLTGTRVSEGMDAAPGDIRAYDVHTGAQKWIFHTIPHAGEPGHETWDDPDAWKMTGGANNWMGMTIDVNTGIAYVPTGSASMDFYGGRKKGADLYADCLLALDASTGRLLWHFQYIHHDTWDWDPSSAPVLITLHRNGQPQELVVQSTKTGFLFIFDRATGKPFYPIIETPVDTATTLVGEELWPTQPMPQKPLPFVRQSFTAADINPLLPAASRAELLAALKTYHSGKPFIPQSKAGTIIFPGFDGGGEWGGPAIDPVTGVLYVNANEMAWILKMVDVKPAPASTETYLAAGNRLFLQNCMSCHGADRKGGGNYPSLIGVEKKLDKGRFISFINAGRGMMPAFSHLGGEEKEAIASFVLNLPEGSAKIYKQHLSARDTFNAVPYSISGYNKFLSKEGLPALAPPWGTLTAIDLNTGDKVWKTPLGEDERFKGKHTGVENYGGPVVTKGGLVFIAAAKDGKLRAFNKTSGKLLWETTLPVPGFATPAVYEVNGKEYVVIACGGGKLGTRSGDSYIAYALK